MILRQAEDALGDRVEQRLVRPAGDPARRGVDPARRPVVLGGGVRVEREARRALQIDREFGQLLARAHRDQLVQRSLRPRRHPRLHHQPRAHVDRIEPGAHRMVARDLLPDATVLDRRTAVQPHLFRQVDEQVEVRAEAGAVGCDITLDHQRRHRDREAAADRRHAMIVADPHIVEEHLVDMAVAARELDRAHRDARRLHVDPEIGQTLVLGDGRVGAHDDDAIVAILRPARPDLLPVDLPAVAVGLGAGAQAGQVGAARRFGEKLAPDFLALQRLQHAFLHELAVGAELHQHRHRHPQRNAEIDVRETVLHLLGLEGDLLDMAEPLSAQIGRPVDAGESRVELRLLIPAAEREILFDRQALACRLAELRHHRLAPCGGLGAPAFQIAHAPSPAKRSTRTSSQNRVLPCSSARLRARRMWRCRPISHVTPMPP